jgi:hypothetical protein
MEQSIGLIVLIVAILVLAVLLPFAASFLIDTSASAGRGQGILPPFLVLVASAALLYLGLVLWSVGMHLSADSPTLAAWAPRTMRTGLVLMLSFSIPLSLLTGTLRVWREYAGPLDTEAAERRESRRARRSIPVLDRSRPVEAFVRPGHVPAGERIAARTAA